MVDLTQRGMKNIVKYSGLNNLALTDQAKLKNIIESEYETIHRMYGNNVMDLSINIKLHGNEKKKKCSIHAKIEGPSKIITAHDHDWDVSKVSRSVVENLKSELKKQFKEEGKKWRGISAIIRKYM